MDTDLQKQIFQYIKGKIPLNISMVDELASILELSSDSAYRRIRGEKTLSLEEVYKLCNHFHLSLDQLLNLRSDAFVFTGSIINLSSFKYDQWLKSIVNHVKYMNGFKEKRMYYLCKDIPLFHHFHFKEIAAFKYYAWMRGMINAPEFANKKFSLKEYPEEIFELGKKSLAYYNQLDSVELWNMETINSTIRQIEFYHESDLFKHEEEVLQVYEALEKLIEHLSSQADIGYKFHAEDNKHLPAGSYQMYFNELVIGDNSILGILDTVKVSFVIHTIFNVLMTNDMRFCDNLHDCMQNLMKRSTLISSVSERERSRFFKHLRQRVLARKQNLKA